MPMYSDRRKPQQSAKSGPPFRVARGSLSDIVAWIVRATSPAFTTLLAEPLPLAIATLSNGQDRL